MILEKNERKMNGYAKTRSTLPFTSSGYIVPLYIFEHMLTAEQKEKKKPNCRKLEEKSLAELAQRKFRNCVTSW